MLRSSYDQRMSQAPELRLQNLLTEISNCSLCEASIPSPNPVLSAHSSARILIVGQAPGKKVHASGIPWDDASGTRLRQWMGIDAQSFYDQSQIAILPMGFCYPGKGTSGDLPPRPECAATWHARVLDHMPNIQCTLLIGQYAQKRYCPDAGITVTERVRAWRDFSPRQFLLPHPSPRNQHWLKRNPWFERETVPEIQAAMRRLIAQGPNAL